MKYLSISILVFWLGFGWGAEAQFKAEKTARKHFEKQLLNAGYVKSDFDQADVTAQHTSAHNGVTHMYYRQMFEGLEVLNGSLNIHLDRQGDVVTMANRFKKNLAHRKKAKGRLIPPESAVRLAARELGLSAKGRIRILKRTPGLEQACVLEARRISPENIPAKLKFFATEDGALRLVWDLVILNPAGDHQWNLALDAHQGKILWKTDWVRQDSYRVFPLPLGSPTEGGRSLQVDPADPVASPFGWHDTDGSPGAEFTTTQGNNVLAQEDQNANNATGFRPDGGVGLNFDFPFNLNGPPSNSVSATVVQLFYMNNLMHDIHYRYGFTEAAGNFQENNYGKGGVGGDGVRADALDGSGVNNANFNTPPDGSPGRMQMFIWRSADLEVHAPGNVAGGYSAGSAEFGAQLIGTGLTGTVVRALDAPTTNGPSITDCCTPLTNAASVNGKIALIDRGDCFFVVKVKNAQDAGAIGVIIANNAGNEVITMGGSDPTITIPAVFIGQGNGNTLKAELANGLEATLSGGQAGSSLDTGIVIHEYGHGVSIRLTGGGGNSGCLDGIQSGGMGEGWGDWWALVFNGRPGDEEDTTKGIGTFVSNQPADGPGIRRFPYSTDLSVNPLTYRWVIRSAEVHDVGEIWCAALWDMYWNLVHKYGFDPDFYYGTGGNNVALQLVMDGLKMQPCNPTMLDARDAILSADQVNNAGANQCEIWRSFARRGMGENAMDGGSHNSTNVVEDFSVPAACETPLITSISREPPYEIVWLSLENRDYEIQKTPSLLSPAWTNISGVVTSLGLSTSTTIQTNVPDRLYLRVHLLP